MSQDVEERELVNKELEFKLSSADYERIGKETAGISAELTAFREQKRTEQLAWNDKISSHEDNVARLLSVIQAGKEVRMVNCIERKNFTANQVEYLFNGEVIEGRALTGEERQQEMHLAITGGKVIETDFRKAAAGDNDDDYDEQDRTDEMRPGSPGPEPVECAKEDAVCDEEQE